MLNMALGSEELQGVIQICDPTSSGFVSMEYFTQLARAHYNNQVEADKLLNQLDARGRSYISYNEFATAINAILKEDNQDKSGLARTGEKKDDEQRMMGPSVGQRSIPRKDSEVPETENYESYGSMDMSFSPIQCDGVDGNLNRSTWFRSSLRRNTNHENLPNRRWGSCRHTSGRHVAHNPAVSSLNGSSAASSGRSSACDTPDDVSFDDFFELNNKMERREKSSLLCETPSVIVKKKFPGPDVPERVRSEEEGNSSPQCPSFDDMLTEEETPSLGSGLEYDLWEGQFAFSGTPLPPSPLTKNGFRSPSFNKACSQLSQHVQMLEEHVFSGDERYVKVKQDNATLQSRILMLEEQNREIELRAQEKLNNLEKWHKDTLARMEIEKKLQLENCALRIKSMEVENFSLRDEAQKCHAQSEKFKNQIEELEVKIFMSETTIAKLQEDLEIARDQERRSTQNSLLKQQQADEALQEVECLKIELNKTIQELERKGISPATHEQLRNKVTQLREENRRLQEAHEETQALLLNKGIEEGRSLLTEHQSLAAEFEELSQDQPAAVNEELEAKVMLKEQQEVNAQLRRYIDGILLNIVDNYPQLLEVKPALP